MWHFFSGTESTITTSEEQQWSRWVDPDKKWRTDLVIHSMKLWDKTDWRVISGNLSSNDGKDGNNDDDNVNDSNLSICNTVRKDTK